MRAPLARFRIAGIVAGAWLCGCASPGGATGGVQHARGSALEEAAPAAVAPTAARARVPLEVSVEDWRFAAYPGQVLTTPNYRVYTTITSPRIRQRLPVFIEEALAYYTTALADLPSPPRRVETYIFGDRRQWSAKTRQLLPDQAGAFDNLGRGGFTTRGISVLYYIDWGGRDGDTFAIASHEGWHQYTQSTFKHPLPIWLEEGIATYVEGYRFPLEDVAPSFRASWNNERAKALGDAIAGDQMIPLRELVQKSPQSFLEDGKSRLLAYYAQVWALTRFLADGADGRYRDQLAAVLEDAAAGRLVSKLARAPAVIARGGRRQVLGTRTGPWVILAYFTSDLAEFEQQYLEYAERIAR